MDGVEQSNQRRYLRIASWATVAALLIAACGSGVQDGPPTHVTADGNGATAPSETNDRRDETTPREPLAATAVPDESHATTPTTTTVPEGSLATTTPTAPTAAGPQEPPERVLVASLDETTLATPIGLQTGIDALDPGDAEVFNWRPDTPEDLLPTAWRATIFGKGEHADPPRRPTELIVATPWPRAIRANVLCLVDAAQVRCSDHAAVWRVEIDEPAMVLLELPETEDRRDIIFVEERDGRPEGIIPVSRTRSIDGWEVPFSTTGDPPPGITNPLGGCDWVLFMQSLEPREAFKLLRVRDPSSPVYMVISVCADHPSSYEMTPLVVVNETTVAQIEAFQPFTARPGATYAWKLPDKLLKAATTIRGAVVRQAPDGGSWVTHPLATNTNQ